MRPQSRRERTRGQGLVEFALIFPVMILILVGIFDVGRLIFAYNDITNAAREATRLGIVNQTIGAIQNEAINQAETLGLNTGQVDVKFCDLAGTTCTTTKPTDLDAFVKVQVSYSWTAITPVVGNIIGPVTVTAVSQMPIERVYP
jgi:Flp pilus assembly protein TadG